MVFELDTTINDPVSLKILEGIRLKKRTNLARGISLVENGSCHGRNLLARAFKFTGHSKVTGITGAPGVGKSTLVDGLVSHLRERGHSVGIIAVDPSSPFTGGAILGDRVRMRSRTTDEEVFFRSLSTRGHLGGLSRYTGDVITLMDVFGFDDIIVETVGAGQSEVDIMKYALCVVVVVAPGLGDDIQAIKAGIFEIGDVFCVNKADLPGAQRTVRELEMMLNLKNQTGWRPPVIETVASSGQGLDKLVDAIEEYQTYLSSSNLLKKKVKERYRKLLEEYVRRETVERIMEEAESDGTLEAMLSELVNGRSDPSSCAKELVKKHLNVL